MSSTAKDFPYSCDIHLSYPSQKCAEIAKNTLDVDEELSKGNVRRTMTVIGESLHVEYRAVDARVLRIVTSSFFDMAAVVSRTFQEFSED